MKVGKRGSEYHLKKLGGGDKKKYNPWEGQGHFLDIAQFSPSPPLCFINERSLTPIANINFSIHKRATAPLMNAKVFVVSCIYRFRTDKANITPLAKPFSHSLDLPYSRETA